MRTALEIKAAIAQLHESTTLELIDTLKPTFDAKQAGYESVDDARLWIAKMAKKGIETLCAELLKVEKV